MTIHAVCDAINLIRDNFQDTEIDFSGPQSIETINKAEKALGVCLSESYKVFLKEVGCGGVGSLEIYGIIEDEDFNIKDIPFVAVPNAIWSTLQWHRDFNHPLYLVIIYNVGEGTLYCLDTSQMNEEGECPVVAWPIGGYEMTPKLEVIAPDFGAFFLDMVKRQIAYKEECKRCEG